MVGGWVRDHLLNLPSNDLDITIKGIDSKIFVQLLNDKVYKNKYIISNKILKRPNGTQIKLTKTVIFDIMIDFFELNESAVEDAKRRDFTFNSLYYNILENKIEDLLNIGINDLKNGLIRTCASTNQVINYNSLPVLRMLRFATKYKFVINGECLNEIEKNKKILQNNILNDISKETIHKDIYLIFCGPNPSFAIYSLYKFGLLEYVLQLDSHNKNDKEKAFTEKDILNCVNIFIVGEKSLDKYKNYFEGEIYDNKYKYALYSILLSIYMKNFTSKYKNSLAKIILANALRIECKDTLRIIYNFDEFNNFIAKNEYNKLHVGI